VFCLALLMLELVWRRLAWEYLKEFLHVMCKLLEGCCHVLVVSCHHVVIVVNDNTELIQPV